MRRALVWLLILAFLAGGGYLARDRALAWWKARSALKYLTSPVTRGRVETLVNSTGTIKAVRTVPVGAFISGPVAHVYAEFNSKVAKDQILAEIDPRLLKAAVDRDEAALETQQAELARIEAQLKQAQNNEDRAKRLAAVNPDYLSQMEMDQYHFARKTYEAQLRLYQASIRQAEASLQNTKQNLEYTQIKAPEAGVVIERKIDEGQTVAASFQTPELFTLALELDRRVYIYVSVDEADVGLIRRAEERQQALTDLAAVLASPGTDAAAPALLAAHLAAADEFARPAVKFTVDAYPGELFPGRIFQIRMNSTTTQNVVTYPVVIEAANPGQKLMPGMTANVTFQVDSRDDALRVPAAALRYLPPAAQVRPEDRHFVEAVAAAAPAAAADSAPKKSADEKADLSRKRQRRLVWVKDGELLRAVPVTLGLIENQWAELVDGDLAEGQVLVTGTETAFGSR